MEDERSINSNHTTSTPPLPDHLERDSIITDDGVSRPTSYLLRRNSMFRGSVASGSSGFRQVVDGSLSDMLQGALDVDDMLLSDGDSDSEGQHHNLIKESFHRRALLENAFRLHNCSDDFDNITIGSSRREKEETIIFGEESPPSLSSQITLSKTATATTIGKPAMDRSFSSSNASSSSSSISSTGTETTIKCKVTKRTRKVKSATRATAILVKKKSTTTMKKPAAFKPHVKMKKEQNCSSDDDGLHFPPNTTKKREKDTNHCILQKKKKNFIFYYCLLIVVIILISTTAIFILLRKKNIIVLPSSGEKATIITAIAKTTAVRRRQ